MRTLTASSDAESEKRRLVEMLKSSASRLLATPLVAYDRRTLTLGGVGGGGSDDESRDADDGLVARAIEADLEQQLANDADARSDFGDDDAGDELDKTRSSPFAAGAQPSSWPHTSVLTRRTAAAAHDGRPDSSDGAQPPSPLKRGDADWSMTPEVLRQTNTLKRLFKTPSQLKQNLRELHSTAPPNIPENVRDNESDDEATALGGGARWNRRDADDDDHSLRAQRKQYVNMVPKRATKLAALTNSHRATSAAVDRAHEARDEPRTSLSEADSEWFVGADMEPASGRTFASHVELSAAAADSAAAATATSSSSFEAAHGDQPARIRFESRTRILPSRLHPVVAASLSHPAPQLLGQLASIETMKHEVENEHELNVVRPSSAQSTSAKAAAAKARGDEATAAMTTSGAPSLCDGDIQAITSEVDEALERDARLVDDLCASMDQSARADDDELRWLYTAGFPDDNDAEAPLQGGDLNAVETPTGGASLPRRCPSRTVDLLAESPNSGKLGGRSATPPTAAALIAPRKRATIKRP